MINKNYSYFNHLIYNKCIIIIFFLLFLNFFFLQINNESNTNIPELFYFNNQTLRILIPEKKCKYVSPITLYFSSNFRNDNIPKEFEVKEINIKDKNYFVSFFVNNFNYDSYIQLLNHHGLIRSKFIYGNNNLFISHIGKNPLSKINNDYDLNKYQKVYQYIEGDYFFTKNILYSQYKSLKNLFFQDFDYMPETYNYPEDRFIIQKYFKNYKLNLSDLWILKPTNKYGGKGIKILKSLDEIKFKQYIISKYIVDIDLIKSKKYDLRLYILISGLKPLRIYFYDEGLIRIASEKYSVNIKSIKNKFMHLTNTDVNKYNKKFIHPTHFNDENANMWNLNMYKKYLKKSNVEWNDIYERIKDIIIKTIISLNQKLIESNEEKHLDDKSFYNLLGFDILMTKDFVPKLLEVNYSPQMFIHNNLDRSIKNNLFVDTLNIVGIIPYSRKTNLPLNTQFKVQSNIEENINNALCELNRPRGDYKLIFPLKDNINRYKKYFIQLSEENLKFWTLIK